MKRPIAVTLGVFLLAGAGVLNFRQDFYSQYHFDTLREERYKVTKVFGIPIWREARQPSDTYTDSYTRITGKAPDPERWRKMPPDYTRSLVGGMHRCFGTPFPLRERNELLETLYRRFAYGMPQDEALRIFERIDRVAPEVGTRDKDINLEALDEIRAELGLERRFTIAAEQADAANPHPPRVEN